MPAVKAALICLLLGGSAIGYVYQKNQIGELGKMIQQREKTLAKLQDENAKLGKTLSTLKSAAYLEEKVKRMNLNLAQPAQSQLLTIIEVPAAAAPKAEPLNPAVPSGRDRIAAIK